MQNQKKCQVLVIFLILTFVGGCAKSSSSSLNINGLASAQQINNPSFAAQVTAAGGFTNQDYTQERWNQLLSQGRRYTAYDLRTRSGIGSLIVGLGTGAALGVVGAKGAPWRSSAHRVADGVISGIGGTNLDSSNKEGKLSGKLPELSHKELTPNQLKWLEYNPGSYIFAWMPADQAPGASSAQEKLRKIIEQAIEQTSGGGGIRLVRLNLPETKPIPPFIAQTIGQEGQSWSWVHNNTVAFSPSLYDPDKKRIYAKFDDVSFWKEVSAKLPKWCFISLDMRFTSDGEYFLGYPLLVWQGKIYEFVDGATGSSQVTASKRQ